MAEVSGCLEPDKNYIWKKVIKWVDYHLKGIENGIMNEPPVTVQIRNIGGLPLDGNRLQFKAFPSDSEQIFHLMKRTGILKRFGSLSTDKTDSSSDSFYFGKLSGLNLGIPVFSEFMQSLVDVPIYSSITL